jgi:hypothetical protein
MDSTPDHVNNQALQRAMREQDLELLQRAVMEEWGFNWKTSPAARRVLGGETFDNLLVEMCLGQEAAQ